VQHRGGEGREIDAVNLVDGVFIVVFRVLLFKIKGSFRLTVFASSLDAVGFLGTRLSRFRVGGIWRKEDEERSKTK